MEFAYNARKRFDEIIDAFYIDTEMSAMHLAEEDGVDKVHLEHVEDAYLTVLQSYRSELLENSKIEILGKGGGDMCTDLVRLMGDSVLGEKGQLMTQLFIDNKADVNVKWVADSVYDGREWMARKAYTKFFRVLSGIIMWYFIRDIAMDIMSEKHSYALYRRLSGDGFRKIGEDLGVNWEAARDFYDRSLRHLISYLLFR